MASTEEVVKRLKESRPPATDPFTYLTIIEKSLSPEILPALQEILDDAELTNDIGWDLVDMLISVPGSAECLERIARLGNPREVILKILEVMDKAAAIAAADRENKPQEGHGELKEEQDSANDKFIALVGMLKILHGRLQVRSPSRFLHNTLDTVLRAYDPTSPKATAAIIDLIKSLSGPKRPPLPNRQSSTKLETPFQATDPSQTAPDPEADNADQQGPAEPELMSRLLRSFLTCIIEAYVNSNSLQWASRLLEYTIPERIVPRTMTMLEAYNKVEELQAMDSLVGELVAVACDLGLSKITNSEMREILTSAPCRDPLSMEDSDPKHPEGIKLSTGGLACLTAYWMFASDVFDAHHDNVDIDIFPEHHKLLQNLIGEDSQDEITGNPGTTEALVVIAIWVDAHKGTLRKPSRATTDQVNFMSYHHLLTLISVFHPNIRVRNAATVMAGLVLHADPEESDRLAILEDLLENCVFSTLQACAVTWLKEEIIAARKEGSNGPFSGPECFEKLQYTVFPDLKFLTDVDKTSLWEYWSQSSPFHVQVANFVRFLFGGKDFKDVAPAGMVTAVEHRYVGPLLQAAKTLLEALDKKELSEPTSGEAQLELSIVIDTLNSVPLQ